MRSRTRLASMPGWVAGITRWPGALFVELVRRKKTLGAGHWLLLVAVLTCGADAATQKPNACTQRSGFTEQDLAEAHPEGLAPQVRLPADDPERFRAFLRDTPMASRAPWLILSSGGENGAFAAGLLMGWSEAGTRPSFAVITGVSTGALIAPFAFIGAKGDATLEKLYTTTSAADVFEFGGTPDGLTDTWPLKRQIERTVTASLLNEVAAEHRAGRRLLVVTTELDSGRPILWDMGAVAVHGGPAALTLFRAVLLASAAIPGVFPPVMIEARGAGKACIQEMHADGSITAPFYLAPAPTLLAEDSERLPAPAIYLVVNQRLRPEFQIAQRTVLDVLGRALSAAIKAQVASALALTRAYTRRTGQTLQVALLDGRFDRTSNALFDADYMKALFAHGRTIGRAGTAFEPIDHGAPATEPTNFSRLQPRSE